MQRQLEISGQKCAAVKKKLIRNVYKSYCNSMQKMRIQIKVIIYLWHLVTQQLNNDQQI